LNTGSQGYMRRANIDSSNLFYAEVHSGGRVPCDDRS
jgi:hypothetical protein